MLFHQNSILTFFLKVFCWLVVITIIFITSNYIEVSPNFPPTHYKFYFNVFKSTFNESLLSNNNESLLTGHQSEAKSISTTPKSFQKVTKNKNDALIQSSIIKQKFNRDSSVNVQSSTLSQTFNDYLHEQVQSNTINHMTINESSKPIQSNTSNQKLKKGTPKLIQSKTSNQKSKNNSITQIKSNTLNQKPQNESPKPIQSNTLNQTSNNDSNDSLTLPNSTKHLDTSPTQINSTFKELEEEFKRRNEHVKRMCRNLHIQPAPNAFFGPIDQYKCTSRKNGYGYNECIFTDNFQLHKMASSMVCIINKVASTTIVNTLLNVNNISIPDDTSPHVAVVSLYPKTIPEFLFARKYFFKYLVVRDPLRRLLSAYKNKVENTKDSQTTLIYLREDINYFIASLKGSPFINIKENESLKENNISTLTNASRYLFKERIPSFEDFLEFIMRYDTPGDGFDSHWVPYWKKCAPCSMDYDVIAKLDTDLPELQYIWSANGFSSKDVPWKQRSLHEKGLQENIKKYYSNLSTKIILKVYKTYLLDFKLFNYNIYDILKLGNHCRSNDDCDQIIIDYFHYLP